jgi:hypothetical protein
MTFPTWIDTFISEKGLDLDHVLEAEGASGRNFIPLAVLVDAIKAAPDQERRAIKHKIVKLDFINAPVMPFFTHLAQAIAI